MSVNLKFKLTLQMFKLYGLKKNHTHTLLAAQL